MRKIKLKTYFKQSVANSSLHKSSRECESRLFSVELYLQADVFISDTAHLAVRKRVFKLDRGKIQNFSCVNYGHKGKVFIFL